MNFMVVQRKVAIIFCGFGMLILIPPLILGVALLDQYQLSQVIFSLRIIVVCLLTIGGVLGFGRSIAWYRANPRYRTANTSGDLETPEVLKIRNYRPLLVGICVIVLGVFILNLATTGNMQSMIVSSMMILVPAGVAIIAFFGASAVCFSLFKWYVTRN